MLLPLPLPKGEDEGEGFSASKIGSFQMRTLTLRLLTLPSPRSRRRGDRSKALRGPNSATPDARARPATPLQTKGNSFVTKNPYSLTIDSSTLGAISTDRKEAKSQPRKEIFIL